MSKQRTKITDISKKTYEAVLEKLVMLTHGHNDRENLWKNIFDDNRVTVDCSERLKTCYNGAKKDLIELKKNFLAEQQPQIQK